MKHWLACVVAISLLGLAGCGDDTDGGGTADAGGGGDGGGAKAPVISKVAWTTPSSCSGGVASVYTIVTTATDGDTATDQLTYQGTVASCTGTINKMTSTVTCPNAASYQGSVTVKDPQGNMDVQTFLISPCANGMAP